MSFYRKSERIEKIFRLSGRLQMQPSFFMGGHPFHVYRLITFEDLENRKQLFEIIFVNKFVLRL
jgi:hypothetical protein